MPKTHQVTEQTQKRGDQHHSTVTPMLDTFAHRLQQMVRGYSVPWKSGKPDNKPVDQIVSRSYLGQALRHLKTDKNNDSDPSDDSSGSEPTGSEKRKKG